MSRVAALLACAPLFLGLVSTAQTPDPAAEEVVRAAMARAPSIERQAANLAYLAWPTKDGDPEVAALARKTLVEFGARGMPALRGAVLDVNPEDQADVVRVILEVRDRIDAGVPQDLFPALESAVWYGTRDARLIAIPELGRYRVYSAVVTIIDAGYEDPELVATVIDSLGAIGDDRARLFLQEQLLSGDPSLRARAAAAMARIGGRAIEYLKDAMRSEDSEIRLTAVRALLPVAGIDDLSALYEYTHSFPEDDPELVDAVRKSTVRIEELLADRYEGEAASPMPE